MADVGYLQDDNGNKSAMRLMCLMAMIAAIAFGALVVFRGDPSGNGLYISAMFLAAAMGGKIGQKALEQPGMPKATLLQSISTVTGEGLQTGRSTHDTTLGGSPVGGTFNPLGAGA